MEIFILICLLVLLVVIIYLLAAMSVFFNLHSSIPTLLLFGFYYLFLYIIDKNQVKIITKGYRILFTLLIQLSDLKDESRVKLIKLVKNSEKHKKMFKQYIVNKSSWSDYFNKYKMFWSNKAWSVLNNHKELLKEYENIINKLTETEKKRRERRKKIKNKVKSLFHLQ